MTKLYYESHVTVDPLEGLELNKFKSTCNNYGFKVAELLMVKEGFGLVNSDKDSFCTTRSKNFDDISKRTKLLIYELNMVNIKVRRYKIEDTLIDSKISDDLNIL